MRDAGSLPESRTPHQTLYDAYTIEAGSEPLARIPSTIPLQIGVPTEIDFQNYFPQDTITKVDILRLPQSSFRRLGPTVIAFETQNQEQDITVRVTFDYSFRDYSVRLLVAVPQIRIDNVNNSGETAGTISQNIQTPLAVQTYLGNKSWVLTAGVPVSQNRFSTTLLTQAPTMTFS